VSKRGPSQGGGPWSRGRLRWRGLALIAAPPLLSAVVGAALVAWLVGDSFSAEQVLTLPTPTATVPPTATAIPPSEAPIERLIIEGVGVGAPVEVQSVQAGGFFPTPSGPEKPLSQLKFRRLSA
jgi:hypothetical protein